MTAGGLSGLSRSFRSMDRKTLFRSYEISSERTTYISIVFTLTPVVWYPSPRQIKCKLFSLVVINNRVVENKPFFFHVRNYTSVCLTGTC